MFNLVTVGADYRNAAVVQGGDTNAPITVNG
jgi:hypothetical protein